MEVRFAASSEHFRPQVGVVQQHVRVTLAAADPDHVPFRIDVLAVRVLALAAGEELRVVGR